MDETYIKIKGRWTYLYRAVDKYGDTIDFYLSSTRNAKAAKRILGKALNGLKDWQKPATINTDKAPTYGIAIAALKKEGKLPAETLHRPVKYLNNVIETDHGKLKQLINPVRGFKSLKTAYATIKGFEVMRSLKERTGPALAIWRRHHGRGAPDRKAVRNLYRLKPSTTAPHAAYLKLCIRASGAKSFLLGFEESLWSESSPHGVHVLNLMLGRSDTPAFRPALADKGLPLPPGLADPLEVARTAQERLRFGPVHNWGATDDQTGFAPTSPDDRSSRIARLEEIGKTVMK